jgi:thymidylate synthase
MNKLDKQYTDLLQDILDNGVTKQDRTVTGTISVFGRQIRHNMKDGFPLLTTKKMPFKTIVTELLWFLRGDTNIKFLVDNNCHIWNGDAYKNFEQKVISEGYQNLVAYYWPSTQEEFINKIKTDDKFAKKWGELGPIYGKQWRSWNGIDKEAFFNSDNLDERNRDARHGMFYKESEVDQIQNLINDLKENPDSRRLMVNAWNVGELDQMVLPPCHYGFQVYTRELSFYELRNKLRNSNEGWFTETAVTTQDLQEECTKRGLPIRAISLMWNQRSVDTFLGLPFNIASYGLLLEIIAKEVNMIPDELIGNLGDVHLYSNHIEQAKEQIGRELTHDERIAIYSELGLTESIESRSKRFINKEKFEPSIPKRTREPFQLSTLKLPDYDMFEGKFCPEYWLPEDFKIDNYQSHPTIKAPLSN